MRRKIINVITLLAVVALAVFGLGGCAEKASKYTEEEHIQRVKERIQKRFIDTDLRWINREQPTDFEVYPLYNENDELSYFLVEFEPYGFIFVLLRDEQSKASAFFGASASMYRIADNIDGNNDWSPYIIDETNSQPAPDTGRIWILDEKGEKIVYDKSPYAVAQVASQRRYLLYDRIPAIKSEEKFINLISMEEIEFKDGSLVRMQACMHMSFWPKIESDL